MSNYIVTASGRMFYPLDPSPEDICIEDIAHALSNICRFTGHVRQFYSVAEHCVLVSMYCDARDTLHGLLHDASEAYLCDVSGPVKHTPVMYEYRQAEKYLQRKIFERFGLDPEIPASVKRSDLAVYAAEVRDLMPNHEAFYRDPTREMPQAIKETIISWKPWVAEQLFLARFRLLTKQTTVEIPVSVADHLMGHPR